MTTPEVRSLNLFPIPEQKFWRKKPFPSVRTGNDTLRNYHWLLAPQDIPSILHDFAKFLREFPKEVVFIDFHEFPRGFESKESFKRLEDMVDEILGW